MKKVTLWVVMSVFGILTAWAQAPVAWSVKAGMGVGNLMGGNLTKAEVRLAYKVGVELDCPLEGNWSLRTGLSWVTKGTNYTIVQHEDLSAQAQVNAFYLELPLMIALRLPIARHAGMAVKAGAYGAWGVGGKTKALGYNWTSSEKPDWDSNSVVEMETFSKEEIGLRRFDYGLGVGWEVEYRHFLFGIEAQLGLSKLQKELGAKNVTAFATVGYRW